MLNFPEFPTGKIRDKGSYVLSRFAKQEQELNRLQKQASILPSLENKVLKKNGLSSGMKVLDAACGPGIISRLMHRIVCENDAEGEVTGIDQDEELIRIARGLARDKSLDIRFFPGDIYHLQFPAYFDYAYCRFLFQHLNDPVKALKSLYRSLKAGGKIHILDVNDEWLFLEPENPAFNELCKLALTIQQQEGGNRLIGKKMYHLLLAAGFENVQVEVHLIHSGMLGIPNFLEITTLFKLQMVANVFPEKAKNIEQALESEIDPNHAFGSVALFSISATKPL